MSEVLTFGEKLRVMRTAGMDVVLKRPQIDALIEAYDEVIESQREVERIAFDILDQAKKEQRVARRWAVVLLACAAVNMGFLLANIFFA